MVVALLAAGVGMLVISSLFRPLLRSNDYQVTAAVDDVRVDATLLEVFPSGSYYVLFDDNPAPLFNQFGVAFKRASAFVPISLRRSKLGFHYIHADQDKGIALTDGKLEDDWVVDFTTSGVTFKNASTEISLSR